MSATATDFVLDCSVTIAWCIEDEADAATDALLDSLSAASAIAPPLWVYEVGNVLIQAERRGRISESDIMARLDILADLPIEIDTAPMARGFGDVLHLARAHQLTSYDAAYLDLAMRKSLPLATRDKALRKAAKAIGVDLLPAD
jgi:predicted nucleic acid-binding protein